MVGQVILVSVVGAMVLAGIVLPVWAYIDIFRRPEEQWRQSGQNKLFWIVLIVITLLACAAGWIVPTIYLVTIRPKLDAVATTEVPRPPPRPGADPAE
ncbi:MAG: hypothetical protein ACXV95_10395 [Acidimicrobiales bacterium]